MLGNPNVCNSTISETIQTKKKHKIQKILENPNVCNSTLTTCPLKKKTQNPKNTWDLNF